MEYNNNNCTIYYAKNVDAPCWGSIHIVYRKSFTA